MSAVRNNFRNVLVGERALVSYQTRVTRSDRTSLYELRLRIQMGKVHPEGEPLPWGIVPRLGRLYVVVPEAVFELKPVGMQEGRVGEVVLVRVLTETSGKKAPGPTVEEMKAKKEAARIKQAEKEKAERDAKAARIKKTKEEWDARHGQKQTCRSMVRELLTAAAAPPWPLEVQEKLAELVPWIAFDQAGARAWLVHTGTKFEDRSNGVPDETAERLLDRRHVGEDRGVEGGVRYEDGGRRGEAFD